MLVFSSSGQYKVAQRAATPSHNEKPQDARRYLSLQPHTGTSLLAFRPWDSVCKLCSSSADRLLSCVGPAICCCCMLELRQHVVPILDTWSQTGQLKNHLLEGHQRRAPHSTDKKPGGNQQPATKGTFPFLSGANTGSGCGSGRETNKGITPHRALVGSIPITEHTRTQDLH